MPSLYSFDKTKATYKDCKMDYLEFCEYSSKHILRVIDLSRSLDKKKKIRNEVIASLGFFPDELVVHCVNCYGDNTDAGRIKVSLNWLNRQRCFETPDGKFPIGLLLKQCLDEIYGRTSEKNRVRVLFRRQDMKDVA